MTPEQSETYRRLWEAEVPRLSGWLRKKGATPDEAEDIISDAMVRIMTRNYDHVQPGLLWHVAGNGLADYYRKTAAPRPVDTPPDLLPEKFPSARMARQRADLTRAMALPLPIDRVAWGLANIRGFTTREVAEHLNISQSTAARSIERARAIMKEALA